MVLLKEPFLIIGVIMKHTAPESVGAVEGRGTVRLERDESIAA